MIDGRVAERPRGDHMFFKLKLWLFGKFWLNWRLGGALRWKVEIAGWEGQIV
jgi:hypothetical protein